MTNLTQSEQKKCNEYLEQSIRDDDLENIMKAFDDGANTLDHESNNSPISKNNECLLIFLALEKCSFEIVKYLIKRGINLDCNSLSDSYLSRLVKKGPPHRYIIFRKMKTKDTKPYKLCKLLIQNGAPVNYTNYRGISVLMIAVIAQYHQAVELLLKFGADTTLESKDGVSALDYAVKYKDTNDDDINKSLKHLLEYNDSFYIICRALSQALHHNNCNARVLILYGAEKFTNYKIHEDMYIENRIDIQLIIDVYPLFPTIFSLQSIAYNGTHTSRADKHFGNYSKKNDKVLYEKYKIGLIKETPIFTLKVLAVRRIYLRKPAHYKKVKELYPLLFKVEPGNFTKWPTPTNKIK